MAVVEMTNLESPAEHEQLLVLVGRVDEHRVAGLLAANDEHVVVVGANDQTMDFHRRIRPVQRRAITHAVSLAGVPGTGQVDLLGFLRALEPLSAGRPADFARDTVDTVDADGPIGRAEARPHPCRTRCVGGPGGTVVLPSAGGVVVLALVRRVGAGRSAGGGFRSAELDHRPGARRNGVANHPDCPGGVRGHAAHRGGGSHQRSRHRKSQAPRVVCGRGGHVGGGVPGWLLGGARRPIARRDQRRVRHVGQQGSAGDRR